MLSKKRIAPRVIANERNRTARSHSTTRKQTIEIRPIAIGSPKTGTRKAWEREKSKDTIPIL